MIFLKTLTFAVLDPIDIGRAEPHFPGPRVEDNFPLPIEFH